MEEALNTLRVKYLEKINKLQEYKKVAKEKETAVAEAKKIADAIEDNRRQKERADKQIADEAIVAQNTVAAKLKKEQDEANARELKIDQDKKRACLIYKYTGVESPKFTLGAINKLTMQELNFEYSATFEGVASIILVLRDAAGELPKRCVLHTPTSLDIIDSLKDPPEVLLSVESDSFTKITTPSLEKENFKQYKDKLFIDELAASFSVDPTTPPACFVCYGQSGSGKTAQLDLILKECLKTLLNKVKQDVNVSVVQLYGLAQSVTTIDNVTLYDVLSQPDPNLGQQTPESTPNNKKYYSNMYLTRTQDTYQFIINKGGRETPYIIKPGEREPKKHPFVFNKSLTPDARNLETEASADKLLDFILKRKFLRATENNPESSRCITFYHIEIDGKTLITLVDLPGNENVSKEPKLREAVSYRDQESNFISSMLPVIQAIFLTKKDAAKTLQHTVYQYRDVKLNGRRALWTPQYMLDTARKLSSTHIQYKLIKSVIDEMEKDKTKSPNDTRDLLKKKFSAMGSVPTQIKPYGAELELKNNNNNLHLPLRTELKVLETKGCKLTLILCAFNTSEVIDGKLKRLDTILETFQFAKLLFATKVKGCDLTPDEISSILAGNSLVRPVPAIVNPEVGGRRSFTHIRNMPSAYTRKRIYKKVTRKKK